MNVISQQAISEIMMECLKLENGWANEVTAWNVTANMAARHDSSSRITIDQVFVKLDFPPEGIWTPHDTQNWGSRELSSDPTLFSYVIPPAAQIKKNKEKQKLQEEVVGVFCHKRFERCVAGSCAFGIFERIDCPDAQIAFLAMDRVPSGHVYWGHIKLFNLNYAATSRAYKRMMKDAKVKNWKKVTHLR